MSKYSKQYRSFKFQNLARQAYFEGWYYKQVSADGLHTVSFIPGISKHDKQIHPFIQVIYAEHISAQWSQTTEWLPLDADDFEATDEPFALRLGRNSFRKDGLRVDLEGQDLTVRGELRFTNMIDLPETTWMPTIMGPFSYLPGMECIHSVNSLSHRTDGVLHINGQAIDFTGGKGYIEKDWGSSFPKHYVWLQCNHFKDEDASLFFSWANIPFLACSFEGYIAHLYYAGEHHRFATYTRGGIKIEGNQSKVEIQLSNSYSKLSISAVQHASGRLLAPQNGRMDHAIKEGLFGEISFDFERHDHSQSIQDSSDIAGVEIVWKKEKVSDQPESPN